MSGMSPGADSEGAQPHVAAAEIAERSPRPVGPGQRALASEERTEREARH
jgi:hypothetical protein